MKADKSSAFWLEYYQDYVGKNKYWLDYSNERVQSQTFALALEAAGIIREKSCLDVGCGNGQIALCLKALHAAQVTGVDFMEGFIQHNKRLDRDIHWHCGDVTDVSFCKSLGTFDTVFMLEVLQCLPTQEAVIRALWNQISPGGRMIAMVPNRNCPIASKIIDKLEGNYVPMDPMALKQTLMSLPQVAFWHMRGLHFQQDQRLLPYGVSPWTTTPEWTDPPNRIHFVVEKTKPTET